MKRRYQLIEILKVIGIILFIIATILLGNWLDYLKWVSILGR